MSGSSVELERLVHANSSGGYTRIERRANSTTQINDYTTFRNQVIQNNIQEHFLNSHNLNNFDNSVLSKPILLLACEEKGDFKKVTHDTIKLLLDKGAEADYIDTKWYGWEALHYAAYASNPDKIQVICDKLGEEKVNSLTMLSENALHVLLEHGALAQSFKVSCQNGTDTRMAKIISTEESKITESARILIDAKIDINHTNFWNETPILIAIKRRYFEVVKLLLQKIYIDLDSCKDAVSGRTARELLKGEEGLGVLPTASGSRLPKNVLFSLLKSGNEENFLKYNSGKMCDFVESLDGDNKSNSSCSLLQYCYRRGLIFWHQDKASHDCEHYRHQDITENRLLDAFCESGMAKSIQHLLDNGANINLTLRKFEEDISVLEAAIIKGYYPMVALILSKPDYKLPYKKICQAMVKLLENYSHSIDLNNTISVVLSRLLDQINTLRSREKEEYKDTYQKIEPELSILLKNGAKIISPENQLLLLKFPSSLCWSTEDEDTQSNTSWWCCKNSQETDPEHAQSRNIHRKICFCKSNIKSVLEDIDPEVLRNHLNDCVEQEGTDIKINCDSFLKENSVYSVFETFLSSDKVKEFLNHSVFKILIMRHWENLELRVIPRCPIKYISLNVYFFVFFYCILVLYILYRFTDIPCPCLSVLLWIFLVIFTGKELLQVTANCKLYRNEKSNLFEVILIILTITTYFLDTEWADVIRVLSLLNSNIVLFFLLENVPACAKYIIILRTLSFYFRYILFYFIQFVAFAICFYILFSTGKPIWYIDLPNKIFETVILFTGNLDYMETPWKQENTNSTKENLFHNFAYKELFSKVIFIIFVLFLAIILQNLLLGLLVIDLSDLHKESALSEQVKRAGFVVRVHTFFKSGFMKIFLRIFQYSEMTPDLKITVNDHDRKILTKEEKQNLDFILTKKIKRPNVLKKLRNCIRMKINERNCESLRNDKNKQIVDKLEVIQEIIKSLHETQELKK